MKDRVPTYPGRVKLVPVSGQANTYDMVRADEPVVEGTLLNKATLLSDETAAVLGGPETVDEALTGAGIIWVQVPNAEWVRGTVSLAVARDFLAAATDGNGQVLFGGGNGSTYTERFDTAGNRTLLSPVSVMRSELAAASDGAGNVLFGGGRDANYSAKGAVDKYSRNGTRTTLTDLSQARVGPAVGADGNGNVLFGGGGGGSGSSAQIKVVDKYTPAGVRSTLALLESGRLRLAGAADGNGNVLFAGGEFLNSDLMPVYVATVDKYDKNGVHTTLSSLSIARSMLAGAMDGSGNVIFAGGMANNEYRDVVDRYDKNGTRTTLTVLSQKRRYPTAVADGDGYVLVGGGDRNSYYDTVDKYSPNGTRTTGIALSSARSHIAGAADSDGNVLFGGGMSSAGASSTVDRYYKAKTITVPAYCAYRFKEHTAEQPISTASRNITIQAPNSGYFRYGGTLTL